MPTEAIRIRHLYISLGHNFFGHHGIEPSDFEVLEVPEAHCLAGRGIEGDRFLDFKPAYKGQITFFAWEVYETLLGKFKLQPKPPSVFRRNVITEGCDLNELIGREFEIQGVRFMGTQECTPCYWMDQAFCAGAEEALNGNGGLRARIITDGILRAAR